MQTPISIFLRNLFSSWVGLAVNTLIAFFLSPFIIHTLGDYRYGIWSILISIVGYMGLADVGLRRSITRYINHYLGKNDVSKALQVVSTSLAIIMGINAVIILMALACLVFFKFVFPGISSDYSSEIQVVLIIGAVELCIGLCGSVFKRSIEAHDRFHVINGILVCYVVFRATLVVLCLKFYPSLVWLASASCISEIVASSLFVFFAFRSWPSFRIGKCLFNKKIAKKMLNFGWPTFLDNISTRVINYTDLIVIGIILGPSLVTVYSIGQMIVISTENLYSKILVVLTPKIFKQTSLKDHASIIYLLMRIFNLIAFFCIPFVCGFFILGDEFILLWMGENFSESHVILSVLALASCLTAINAPIRTVLSGYDKERLVAGIAGLQAALNLVLSIFFASYCKMGIQGVAYGTLVPAIIINGILLPVILSKIIGISLTTFMKKTCLRWFLPAVLYYFICYFSDLVFETTNWTIFIVNVLLLGIIYCPIGFWFVLDDYNRDDLLIFIKTKVLRVKQI